MQRLFRPRQDLFFHKRTAACVIHLSPGLFLYAAQQRRPMRRRSAIISQQYRFVIGIRAYYCNCFFRVQRQYTVIFQQYDTFLRHLPVQFTVLSTFNHIYRNGIVHTIAIKHAQTEARFKQTLYRTGDCIFTDQPILYSGLHPMIRLPTVELTPIVDRQRCAFFFIFCHMVVFIDILDCTAVRYNIAVKFPFFIQYTLKVCAACTGGLTVDPVIRAHYSRRLRMLNTISKGP